MTCYKVTAVRSGDWWVLAVPEVPGALSQVRSLSQAEEYVREAIAFIAQIPADSFDVSIAPELPEPLAARVVSAREASMTAERTAVEASARTREAVATLTDAGLNGSEVAIILGLSRQRVSQLTRERGPESLPGAGLTQAG